MKLLLDSGPPAARVAAEIASPANLVVVSTVSVWELEIKRSCGKPELPDGWADAIDAAGFVELPVIRRHALAATRLPWHHRDPFNRVLIAQALSEGLKLVTADRTAAAYGFPTLGA